MMTLRKSILNRGIAIVAALLLSQAAAAAPPASDTSTQHGVWQKHEYTFAYLGFTSTYSCDGLADKLKLLLVAAGARRDAKSRPGACASGYGQPDKFARAYLTFFTLAPTDTPSATGAGVEGTWRAVALADRSPRDLALGDCELVEQFQQLVLPMFTTRNVENHTRCIPHQNSGSLIDLRFESFVGPNAKPRPAAGAQGGTAAAGGT